MLRRPRHILLFERLRSLQARADLTQPHENWTGPVLQCTASQLIDLRLIHELLYFFNERSNDVLPNMNPNVKLFLCTKLFTVEQVA